MDSRRFSELSRGRLALLCLATSALAACATVRPEDKERLADPAMIYGSGGQASRQEEHVLENREGSRGSAASAGGCGCN